MAQVFVNFRFEEKIELAMVCSKMNNFPSYEDFVTSAKNAFGVVKEIYFRNEKGAALRNKIIFENFVEKFYSHPDFTLVVCLTNEENQRIEPLIMENQRTESLVTENQRIPLVMENQRIQPLVENQRIPLVMENQRIQSLVMETEHRGPDEDHKMELLNMFRHDSNMPGSWESQIYDLVLDDASELPEALDELSFPTPTKRMKYEQIPCSSKTIDTCVTGKLERKPVEDIGHKISVDELKEHIIESGYDSILTFYESKNTLSDEHRKTLVKVVSLLIVKNHGHYPGTETKKRYAKLIVDLFPSLQTKRSPYNYDLFYDPISRDGFLERHLRHVQTKHRQQTGQKKAYGKIQKKSPTTEAEATDTEKLEEERNLQFLKYASVVHQKHQIIDAYKNNKNHRIRNRDIILREDQYQKILIVMPQLLLFDFEVLHGQINATDMWKQCQMNITSVFENFNIQKQKKIKCVIQEWEAPIQSILMILAHLPPVNIDKTKKKSTLSEALESFIIFFPLGTPKAEIEEYANQKCLNPQLVAVGANKKAISEYFIKIDNVILSAPSGDIISILDYYFKIHYSLNLEYRADHRQFWLFVQQYVYNLPLTKIPTPAKNLAVNLKIE